MHRFYGSLLLTLPLLVGGWIAFSRSEGPPPAEGRSATPALQGVASCATSGCHHGNGDRGQKGSEYTTWVLHDPHARAFEVLLEERSRLIEARLRNLPGPAEARPEQSALCLHCHTQPGADTLPRGPRFSARDGVGCESCHGPAEKWLVPHRAWKDLAPENKKETYARHGMTRLSDPVARAEVCARCHVGTPAASVSHELIAAGHPRLAFELGTFLANLPKHWDHPRERAQAPDLESRSWAIGQVVTARNSLALLAERAEPAARAWPEFAEFECAACHRDIRSSIRPARPGATAPGSLPWGTWPYALLPQALDFQPAPENAAILSDLRKEMQKPAPDARVVRERALHIVAALDRWLQTADQGRYSNPDVLRQTLTSIRTDLRTDPGNPDRTMQRYLALSALYQAQVDLRVSPLDPQLPEFIRQLRGQIMAPAIEAK